jgi:hypothetical protein
MKLISDFSSCYCPIYLESIAMSDNSFFGSFKTFLGDSFCLLFLFDASSMFLLDEGADSYNYIY